MSLFCSANHGSKTLNKHVGAAIFFVSPDAQLASLNGWVIDLSTVLNAHADHLLLDSAASYTAHQSVDFLMNKAIN
jgi:hypothetical protein